MNPANDRWLAKNVQAEERSEKEELVPTPPGSAAPTPEWSRRDDKDVDEILGMGDHAPPVHQMSNANMMTIIGIDKAANDGPDQEYFIDDDQEDVSTLANDTVANGTFFRNDGLSPPRQIRQKSNNMFQSNEFTPSPSKNTGGESDFEPTGKLSLTYTEPETPPKGDDKLFYEGKFQGGYSRRFFRLAIIATILGIFLIAAIAVLSVNYRQIQTERSAEADRSSGGANLRNPQNQEDAAFDYSVRTFSPSVASSVPTSAPTSSPAPTMTAAPTEMPTTSSPTTSMPSQFPTSPPSVGPTSSPTTATPSVSPTASMQPSIAASSAPSGTAPTTPDPTNQPTTPAPTTEGPTMSPTTPIPTTSPTTSEPTMFPTTSEPTNSPTTSAPTENVPEELIDTIVNAPNFPFETMAEIQDRDKSSIGYQVVEWMARDPNLDSYNEATIIHRFALSSFFMGLSSSRRQNNPLLSSWMTYTDFCDWALTSDSESLCNANGQPQNIVLENVGLEGEIAPELMLLGNSLEKLFLTDNSLEGTLPTEFGRLTELRRLRLHNNKLEGTLPTELGNMRKLRKSTHVPRILLSVIPYNL